MQHVMQRKILTVAAMMAAMMAVAAAPAQADPQLPEGPHHGVAMHCVNDRNELLYGNRQPDGSVRLAGYGLDGAIVAHKHSGQPVYKSCTSWRAWIPASS